MSFESMSNIKSKGVEQKELNIPSPADNIQVDADSISQFVEQLLAAQEECNFNVEQITEKFKLFSVYLNNPTSSAEDLVLKLKSLAASNTFTNIEEHSHTLLSSIEDTLKSIRNNINLPLTTNSALRGALKSLKKSMKEIIPKLEDRKVKINQFEELLKQELTLQASANKELLYEYISLKYSVECIVTEQILQSILYKNIRDSRRFIKINLQNFPSATFETARHVLDTPLFKPAICEQTEHLATFSTSVSENISIINLESISNIKSKEVEQKELNIPSPADNIQANAESIRQFVELLLAAQEKCNVNLVQINEKFNLFSTYLNNPTSSAEDLFLKLKYLTASLIFVDAEKNASSLLSSIEEALKSIRNKIQLPFPTNSILRKAVKYLKKIIKKIIPEQESRKAKIKQIKESLAHELPLPPKTDKEIVNEFHSLKHAVECIDAEQTVQNMSFNSIRRSRRFIKSQLPSQKNKLPKAEISRDTD